MNYLNLNKLIANDNIEVLDATETTVRWKNKETGLVFKKENENIIKFNEYDIIIESDDDFINKNNKLIKAIKYD
jgi:hypothetical protein